MESAGFVEILMYTQLNSACGEGTSWHELCKLIRNILWSLQLEF